MPIKSYIAIPTPGNKANLLRELDQVNSCETLPAENKDVIIVLTETETDAEDELLYQKLNKIKFLGHLTMVAGYETKNDD